MNVAAAFQLAVAGLLGAAVQIGVAAVVLGVAFVLVWSAVRGAIR